jgi:uncharacterized membrane protein HdeD (DUF308 family)
MFAFPNVFSGGGLPMSISPSDAEYLERRFAVALRENWHLLVIEGIILALLGAAAIILPQIATLAFTILLSWLFFISGVVGLITTFMMRQAPGFWWSLFSAIVAIAAGVLLIGWPSSGAESLTLLLIFFFILEGIATIMYGLEHKRELSGRWGLLLLSGIVDLLLAAIIFSGLPGSAEWALGLLVGINMLMGGAALIGLALHARNAAG